MTGHVGLDVSLDIARNICQMLLWLLLENIFFVPSNIIDISVAILLNLDVSLCFKWLY